MSPDVQKQLAHFQVNFRFNLPSAPHFGGAGNEKSNPSTTPESVLHTFLVELESILNSKLL